MHRNRKAILLLPLLLLLACEANWREKAATYMRDFQVSLAAVQDAEVDAHRANFVSDPDHQKFQGVVVKVATYGKVANDAIARGNRQDALTQIDLALGEIDTLQREGLLGVKNDQSKAGISALILSVRAVLTGVKVQIQ